MGHRRDAALWLARWQPAQSRRRAWRWTPTLTLPLPLTLALTLTLPLPLPRFDSIKYTLKEKKWNELARLVVHWGAFLAWLPAKTVFLGVWLSGLLTATIVTVTHQTQP